MPTMAGNERRVGGGDEDILDNVSDISEGDIPELPDAEEEDQEMEELPPLLMDVATESMDASIGGAPPVIGNQLIVSRLTTNGHESASRLEVGYGLTTVLTATAAATVGTFVTTSRSTIAREDIEEISDEEAEWSDDIETAGYSDYELMDIANEEGGASADNLIRIIDVLGQAGGELRPLVALSSPTETLYACLSNGKMVMGDRQGTELIDTTVDRPREGTASLPDLLGRLTAALENNSRCGIDDRWVDNVESLATILQEELALVAAADRAGISRALVQVAMVGLDSRVAEAQPKPAYQIRHIKAGLRFLLEALSCDEVTFDALIEAGVQAQLLQLYRQRYMTIPTRLLVLRVMDRTLDRASGIAEAFAELRTELSCSNDSGGGGRSRPVYEQLLGLLQEETKTRIKFALTSTVNKFHLYEMMVRLAELSLEVDSSSSDAVAEIERLLRQVGLAYTTLTSSLSHPVRFLPCSQHWDLEPEVLLTESSRPERSYFVLADQADLLAVMVALLKGPTVAASKAVAAAVLELLALWLETEAGLLYLAAGGQASSALLRALLATEAAASQEDSYKSSVPSSPTNGEANNISAAAESVAGNHLAPPSPTPPPSVRANTGLDLATMVLAVQQLDILTAAMRVATERQDLESRDVLEAVQTLYGLTFTGLGKRSVVRVLTLGRHMDALLSLTRHSTPDGPKDMKKSAARGYANELLLLTVRCTDNVEFLTR